MDPLHALTLWPEWAWAIDQLDKRIENRTWAPPDRLIGRRLAIHAGAYVGGRKGEPSTVAGLSDLIHQAGVAGHILHGSADREMVRVGLTGMQSTVKTSAIVGTAIVDGWMDDDSHEASRRDLARINTGWGVPGQRWWILRDYVSLTRAVPCKGRQGLWPVQGELLEQVRAAGGLP